MTANALRAAVLVGYLFATGCTPVPEPTGHAPPDVVLVSIDSLRADHVGSYGYERDTSPTMDRLASEGVRFETAVSTTSWTLPAHAALFTGLYDPAHGATDVHFRLADGYTTLAERFQAGGWRTIGLYGGPLLHPVFGVDQGFDRWISCMSTATTTIEDRFDPEVLLEVNARSHADITGPRTIDALRTQLTTAGDAPLFLFIHLWDPHYDYIPPAPYDRMFDPTYSGDLDARDYVHNDAVHAGMDPRDLEHVIALYDGEIRFTDDILRQLLELLEGARPGRERLTVITADHGEEFFEHGGKGHQRTLFEESIRVPLILHWPGRLPAGTVVGAPVSLVDIAPTVASLALPGSEPFGQGVDLTPALSGHGAEDRALHGLLAVGGRRIDSLRTAEVKMLRTNGMLAHLDLVRDPRELDLRPGPPPDGPDLPERLDDLLEASERLRHRYGGDDAASRPLDPELADQLRALGYLE
jgi:arylsulfatase A-like enzyme